MRAKPNSRGVIGLKPDGTPKGSDPWFKTLDPEEIVDLLPVISNKKGQMERIKLPLHNSTVTIATQIREQYPQKFRINLDVYRSMLYAGRQLFDYVLLKNKKGVKNSKNYKLAKIMEGLDNVMYDSNFVEELLQKLLEGHLSTGTGPYSRENILERIEKIRPLLSDELGEQCDNWVDDELDNESIKRRVEDRLRKRKYREDKKRLRVVK